MLGAANFLKIPLIILNILGAHVAMTAPNPPPKQQERAKFEVNKASDTIPMVELKGPQIQKVSIVSVDSDSILAITFLARTHGLT